MSIGEVLGSAASGLISSAFGAHQADKNRDFQKMMSNTAYRRAARDLEAAGLNRILALGSPATTPAGVIGSMSMPDLGATMNQAQATDQSIAESKDRQRVIDKQVDQLLAEIERVKQQTETESARTKKEGHLANMAENQQAVSDVTRRFYKIIGPAVDAFATDLGDKLKGVNVEGIIQAFIEQGISGLIGAGKGAWDSTVGPENREKAQGFLTDLYERIGKAYEYLKNIGSAQPPEKVEQEIEFIFME